MNILLNTIPAPIDRSKLRLALGKRYFILKRKWRFLTSRDVYASSLKEELLTHTVFSHQSMLLRPLKDVNMVYQHNKITNLRLAIEKINTITIKPEEVFSLWHLVGKPSKRKGYLEGLVLNQGKIGYGTGGGLCQLGNLLYWMVLHSPLTVTERWRHGFDVFPDVNRKVPFGSGATLSYNYVDFQFKNETKDVFQLHLFLTDSHLKGRLLSSKALNIRYEVYEAEHLIRQEAWGGYVRHNRINRRCLENDVLMADEFITENHAIMMYNPLLEADYSSSDMK